MKIVRLETPLKTAKRCPDCGETKPTTEFHRNAGSYDGWQAYCRPCARERSRLHKERRLAGLIPTVTPSEKTCYDCKAVRPAAQFSRCLARVDGLQPICRDCQRARKRRRLFGVSNEDVTAMLARQDNCCAICQDVVELVVDHCHEKGHVRGLLCNNCNCMLGFAKDDPDRLIAAIAYLLTSEQEVAR